MAYKKVISVLLSFVLLLSLLPTASADNSIDLNKIRKVYLHANGVNPYETVNSSEVKVGERFNLYFAVDNPDMGEYDSTPIEDAPYIKQAIADAEAREIVYTRKAAEEKADELGITDPAERDAKIQEYIDANLERNIITAKTREEAIARHKQPYYDLNGYSVKIYYDGEYFEYSPEDDTAYSGNINYTIPGADIPLGTTGSENLDGTDYSNVINSVGYSPRFYGSGVDSLTGLNYAYVHVYFSGSFLPREENPDNWYNLCAIPLRPKKTGSSVVYIGSSSDYGVKLYAKHSENENFEPLFTQTAVNGGYHTINIVNQVKPNPPVADIPEGRYTAGVLVNLSCSTPDCDIYYSTNGVDFSKYTEAIAISATTEITAYSVKKNDSTAISNYSFFKYNIIPEKPILFEDNGGVKTEITSSYFKDEAFTLYADNKIPYDSTAFPADLTIYYTYSQEEFVVGTDPYTYWMPLSKSDGQPLLVTENNTVRLVAVKENANSKEISDVSVYNLGIQPAVVTADPVSGSYDAPFSVSLNVSTNDAEIYYTSDGSDPAANGTKYIPDSIVITENTVIRAVAKKNGVYGEDSTFSYTISNPAPPAVTASPIPGEYKGSVNVSLVSKDGDNILYSTDNGATWNSYDKPIYSEDDIIIKAKSEEDSNPTVYTFKYKVVPASPVFSPETTTFIAADEVTVYSPETTPQNTSDYTLYYTLDGTDPKTYGEKAPDGPDTVVIPVDDWIEITAVVKKGNKWSEVVTERYDVISDKPTDPQVTLEPGSYIKKIGGEDITVQFIPPGPNTEIYYSCSYGNTPTPDPVTGVNPYDDQPIVLEGAVTIKAISKNMVYNTTSEICIFEYYIKPEAPKAAIESGALNNTLIPVYSPEGTVLKYKSGDFENTIENVPELIYIDIASGNAYDAPGGNILGNFNQTPSFQDEVELVLEAVLNGVSSGNRIYNYKYDTSALSAPYADKLSGIYEETNADGNNNFLVVSLKSNNPSGTEIEYKLNSGEWQIYTEPVLLNKDSVLYTRAVKQNLQSAVSSYVYEFVPPAPIITLPSGNYLFGRKTTIKLKDNLPDNRTYTIKSRSNTNEEATDMDTGNGVQRTLTESTAFKAYVVNEKGKRSANTFRYYIITDDAISSAVYVADPYTVASGKKKLISKHLLSEELYNDGIHLKTAYPGATINYSYTVIKKGTPPATTNIMPYDPNLPIAVTAAMDSVIITAYLTDINNVKIPDSDCIFTYEFVQLEIPVTDLYLADSSKIEYPSTTKFKFVNHYEEDPTVSLYYTTDPDVTKPDKTNSYLYVWGEEIPVASNLTVTAVYFKGCGSTECTDCYSGNFDDCKYGLYGDAGVYKYTIPTVTSGGTTGGGGGGGATVRKYTKDIFLNEHPTHIGYINGYPDGSVKPDGDITREEMSAILYRITNHDYEKPFVATGTVFPDVEASRWSAHDVEYMAQNAVVLGYPDGEFKPSRNLTRAEFAALIFRFTGIKRAEINNQFTDLENTHWAYKEILSLIHSGFMEGYPDKTYKPEKNITRAEVMTVINKILGRKPLESYVKSLKFNPYNDLFIDKWYYVTVLEATITHNYWLDTKGYEYKWEDVK